MNAQELAETLEALDPAMRSAAEDALRAAALVCDVLRTTDNGLQGERTQKQKAGTKIPGAPQYVWAYKQTRRQLLAVTATAEALGRQLDARRGAAELTRSTGVSGRPIAATDEQLEELRWLRSKGKTLSQCAHAGIIPPRTFWEMLRRGRDEVAGVDHYLYVVMYGKDGTE